MNNLARGEDSRETLFDERSVLEWLKNKYGVKEVLIAANDPYHLGNQIARELKGTLVVREDSALGKLLPQARRIDEILGPSPKVNLSLAYLQQSSAKDDFFELPSPKVPQESTQESTIEVQRPKNNNVISIDSYRSQEELSRKPLTDTIGNVLYTNGTHGLEGAIGRANNSWYDNQTEPTLTQRAAQGQSINPSYNTRDTSSYYRR